MWIFTPDSLLMPAAFPADKVEPHIASLYDLQVRSREKKHLDKFCKQFMPAGSHSKIYSTPLMDYEFRFYTTKAALGLAMQKVIDRIDYEKFKPEAKDFSYHTMLNEIWAVVYYAKKGLRNVFGEAWNEQQ